MLEKWNKLKPCLDTRVAGLLAELLSSRALFAVLALTNKKKKGIKDQQTIITATIRSGLNNSSLVTEYERWSSVVGYLFLGPSSGVPLELDSPFCFFSKRDLISMFCWFVLITCPSGYIPISKLGFFFLSQTVKTKYTGKI